MCEQWGVWAHTRVCKDVHREQGKSLSTQHRPEAALPTLSSVLFLAEHTQTETDLSKTALRGRQITLFCPLSAGSLYMFSSPDKTCLTIKTMVIVKEIIKFQKGMKNILISLNPILRK